MASKITPCQKCGISVSYKTKKPMYCAACKKTRPARKPATNSTGTKTRRRPPTRSKKEILVSHLMMEIFPNTEVILNGYYSWLRSPKDMPMQLDVYLPELKLAIEVDGRQHSTYSTFMHGFGKAGLAKFQYLQTCDQLKDRLCQAAGIQLLRIRYDRTITKGYLVRRFENEGILREARLVTTVDEGEGE